MQPANSRERRGREDKQNGGVNVKSIEGTNTQRKP